VAIFAGHALNFKCAAALLRRRIQRVACEALRRFFRFRAQFQNPRHAFANVSSQYLVGAAVFVLDDPVEYSFCKIRLPAMGFTLP